MKIPPAFVYCLNTLANCYMRVDIHIFSFFEGIKCLLVVSVGKVCSDFYTVWLRTHTSLIRGYVFFSQRRKSRKIEQKGPVNRQTKG